MPEEIRKSLRNATNFGLIPLNIKSQLLGIMIQELFIAKVYYKCQILYLLTLIRNPESHDYQEISSKIAFKFPNLADKLSKAYKYKSAEYARVATIRTCLTHSFRSQKYGNT